MKYLTFLLVSIALCSCAYQQYQQSTHNFVYHGTDAIPSNKQFYYVAYGVTGTSSALYSVRGGGNVRDGLVADAKLDLRTNSPLQANQAYANLSIDVIRTETGIVTDGTPNISQVQLTCVVSADIIQYCDELPEERSIEMQVISLDDIDVQLDSLENENIANTTDSGERSDSTLQKSPLLGVKSWEEIKAEGSWDGTKLWYALDKEGSYDSDSKWVMCRIIDAYSKSWRIEYLTTSNKRKRKWIEQSSPLIAPRY